MASNIVHQPEYSFASNTIRGDGLVNGTALATAYRNTTGIRKDVAKWLKTKEANESIAYLARATGQSTDKLVDVQLGNGTWIHSELVEGLKRWLIKPSSASRKQYVYCFKCVETGIVKIGVSNHPETRLESVRTSYPYDIEIAIVIEHCAMLGVNLERQIHRKLKSFRLNGEWFEKEAFAMLLALIKIDNEIRIVDRSVFGNIFDFEKMEAMLGREYVAADRLDEAIALVYGDERQGLLKPSAELARKV